MIAYEEDPGATYAARDWQTNESYLQAEKGDGITAPLIDLAMKKYHAKQAVLEVQNAEKKVT